MNERLQWPNAEVRLTEEFAAWLDALDKAVRVRIAARLTKLSRGLWDDRKSIGGGVVELREHFGAGYRIYVTERGGDVVVVLAGGDKSSQSADVARAKELAANVKE